MDPSELGTFGGGRDGPILDRQREARGPLLSATAADSAPCGTRIACGRVLADLAERLSRLRGAGHDESPDRSLVQHGPQYELCRSRRKRAGPGAGPLRVRASPMLLAPAPARALAQLR